MGMVYTDVVIKNAADVSLIEGGYKKPSQVRMVYEHVLVDSGCGTLLISPETAEKLGVKASGAFETHLANGQPQYCQQAEPVRIEWQDRRSICFPWVCEGAKTTLLGAIPMEDMDLWINPKRNIVEGAHGDKIVGILC
jgi:predicted aspartyl protease